MRLDARLLFLGFVCVGVILIGLGVWKFAEKPVSVFFELDPSEEGKIIYVFHRNGVTERYEYHLFFRDIDDTKARFTLLAVGYLENRFETFLLSVGENFVLHEEEEGGLFLKLMKLGDESGELKTWFEIKKPYSVGPLAPKEVVIKESTRLPTSIFKLGLNERGKIIYDFYFDKAVHKRHEYHLTFKGTDASKAQFTSTENGNYAENFSLGAGEHFTWFVTEEGGAFLKLLKLKDSSAEIETWFQIRSPHPFGPIAPKEIIIEK